MQVGKTLGRTVASSNPMCPAQVQWAGLPGLGSQLQCLSGETGVRQKQEWTPLFINAGGLITEIGGSMAHGSIAAREYRIPAVVGVRQASKKLHTGNQVRVDSSRGIIEILYAI